MKNLWILSSGVALAAILVAMAPAGEHSARIPKSRLADMGLDGMQPIADAAGRRIHGNRMILGNFSAIGIPLNVGSNARLVALLNWSWHPGVVDIPPILWQRSKNRRTPPEVLPSPYREF